MSSKAQLSTNPFRGLTGPKRGLETGKFDKDEPRGVVDLGDGITGQVWSRSVHGGTWYACTDGKFRHYVKGRLAGEWEPVPRETAVALQRYGARSW